MAAEHTISDRVRELRTSGRRWWRRRVLAHRHLLAFLCAVGAVAIGLYTVSPPPEPAETVLVAARDLPAGTVLASGDLTQARWAVGTRPDAIASEPVGRTLASPLRRGEPVTDLRLVTPSLLAGYPGLMALPVRIPDAASVALLRVGDRVDLVAANPEDSRAEVVARDAPVLAVPPEPETAGSGVTGRLVVLGLPESEVSVVSAAAVGRFLSLALSR